MSIEKNTRDVYKDYYKTKGVDRNDLLANKEVLFQAIAHDISFINAIRSIALDRSEARVLDVGCGKGGSLERFLRLGFDAKKLYGIDVLQEYIEIAKNSWCNVNFIAGDARNTMFENDYFDITFSSTTFLQITDDLLANDIAREMIRVTKPTGRILVSDWRYSKPGNNTYKGVSNKRLAQMFNIGKGVSIEGRYKGALIPPIGRRISKSVPSLYFIVSALFPFLVGQYVTVLKKD